MKQETKKIINFDGLYGDEVGKYASDYIFLEPISTRSKIFDWDIKTHLHLHLFQVFILKEGGLLFKETTEEMELLAPCVMLIPPTHLHGIVYKPNSEGYILTLSEAIVEEIFLPSNPIWITFEQIRKLSQFVDEYSFDKIEALLNALQVELFGDNPERLLMVKSLLTQLFIMLHRSTKLDDSKEGNSVMMTYFRKFQRNIKQTETPKSIPEYAAELNITPVHLNRICKAIGGKSAIDLVNQHLIQEAQKRLLHTSFSVSEVAYQLHFEYPNYFAKMFKKYVGVSPQEFRKQRIQET
jgi:AraC family transcriptional activator of pobA